MSVTATLYLLTREQYESDDFHEDYENDFCSGNGTGICFSNIVHEGFPIIWHSPRTWSFEQFLRPLPWGQSFKVSKQQLLDMVPKAIALAKEDLEDESDLKFFIGSFEELATKLLDFEDATHVFIINAC